MLHERIPARLPALLAAPAVVCALALAVVSVGASAAETRQGRPAGGEVYPTKAVYTAKERIDVTWRGVEASGDVQFWMEPAGTPLGGYPHGSYHSDYETDGHYALENPGPGRWEIHWSVLGEDGVYLGGRFTVAAPDAKRVRPGDYGCYTTTTMGLTRSSMGELRIDSGSRYTAMGRSGRYRYHRKTATLRMKSGPLRRRVAHFRPDENPPKVVFLRRENERRGKPTIDVSDTHCYFGQE